MPWPLSIATYFTIWWVVLFAVLPFGVRSQAEAGVIDLPTGADAGAPAAPRLGVKALWTTGIAAIVFAAIDAYVYWAG
jgi:predicted secreted protein